MGKFNLADSTEESSEPEMEELEYDYTLDENIVTDLVRYSRSRIVKNEEQFLLTGLSYLTGFMENPSHFVSGVLIGTAGSGKTHLQHQLEELFPDHYMYQTTSGSEKSIIYDDSWETAYIASLDELQKPGETIIEILKSLHGDDEEYTYQITGDGQGADRDVDEIKRTAIPYWFLYAQYEPDFEMWDRLLKIPVHESGDKNEGVLRTKWDHSAITFGDSEYEYMYDFPEGTKALQDHIRNLPKNAWVKIPAGEQEFDWDAIEHARHIFDIERSETNRVGAMVANLVRASALLNHERRDRKAVNIRNEGTKEAVIAEPQDLANVLSCRDVLMATTHQLDRKKKALCVAIEEKGGAGAGMTAASINDIQEHLRKSNASFVKRHQVEQMLQDLQENYLVEKHERAGENGRHLYEFTGWQSLGKLHINDEFKRVFDECKNPITGEDFIETARQQNRELTPTAEDFMNEAEVSSDSDSGQETFGDASDVGMDVALDMHEEAILRSLHETMDGVIVDDMHEDGDPSIRQMLGVAPLDGHEDEGSTEGTVLDPDNSIWSHGPDEWVETVNDAETEASAAFQNFTQEGLLKTSVLARKGGDVKKMKVSVVDPEEV